MIPFIIGIVLVIYIFCQTDFKNSTCIHDERECEVCPFPCDKHKN